MPRKQNKKHTTKNIKHKKQQLNSTRRLKLTIGAPTRLSAKKINVVTTYTQITPKKQSIIYANQKDRLMHEMSGKIQWLIDLAGSRNTVEAIIDHFGHKDVTIKEIKELPTLGKHTMFFKTAYPDTKDAYQLMVRAGHWIYYDKKGNHWNSYDLMHQPKSTNQFCQTFALIYIVGDYWTPKSTYPNWASFLKPDDFRNNICVVVNFWKYMFITYKGFGEWLINEVKQQNEQTIENNKQERYDINKVELISDDSRTITKQLIVSKLDDICDNAQNISDNAP